MLKMLLLISTAISHVFSGSCASEKSLTPLLHIIPLGRREPPNAVRFLLNHLLSSSLSLPSSGTEAGKWLSHKSWWSLHWTQASLSMPLFHGERGLKVSTKMVAEDSPASFCCQWTYRSSSYCPASSKLAICT